MLFTARLLPGGSSREIANRLDNCTLDGVELASGLTGKGSAEGDRGEVEESLAHSGWVEVELEDIVVLLCEDERDVFVVFSAFTCEFIYRRCGGG